MPGHPSLRLHTLKDNNRKDEAKILIDALPLSEARDLVVKLTWKGDADIDLSVEEPMGGMPGDHLSLADAGPVLLTSQASLDQLNDWIAQDRGEQDAGEQDAGEQDAGELGRPGRLGV